MKRDLVSIKDLTVQEIEDIFALSWKIKKNKSKFKNSLEGKFLGLLFDKPSTRTRVSFEVGMRELGGESIYLSENRIPLGVRESIKDMALTLSRYLDIIVLRTYSQKTLLEFAHWSDIPVINGLTDLLHPCQVLSDLYTLREKFVKLKGLNLSYIGDGNNVCHSLLYGASKMGINLYIVTPKGYEPDEKIMEEAKAISQRQKSKIYLSHEPSDVVKEADVVYTDVWVSMGKEKEASKRKNAFRYYQLNKSLLQKAKKPPLIMHCLPAHRGEEITDEVIDSKYSIVFEQAENRLHVQKAILLILLKK